MAQQLPDSYYRSPFKFNGKELDEETGLYYYGARYYDPKISIWLSVDPLAEKYPNWNPYNYTMQNPINLVDPDGRAPQKMDWDPPTWKSIKGYWKYQIQTKIPNDLKNIANELDNGWRFENLLKGGRQSGFDLRSSLKNGEDSSGKAQKVNGDRNTQVVDITGIDILSSYAGLKTGSKKLSNSDNTATQLIEVAEILQSWMNASSLGKDTGEMLEMQLKEYEANSTSGWNNSKLNLNERDTLVKPSQKGVIDRINKVNLMKATQEKKSKNRELQKQIDYYKS